MHSFSIEVWNDNYRHYTEKTIEDTWKRIAEAAAKIETEETRQKINEEFYKILEDFKFVPGGRIMANIGIEGRDKTTLFNCFVHHPKDIKLEDPDSMHGIYTLLESQAETLKSEGG